MDSIAVIILTYNEKKHLARCLENVKKLTDKIYIVDSFSTDNSLEIARSFGAVCIQHKWENNHARQFNWGLENLPEKPKWVLRLDADEYLTSELIEEIKERLPGLEAYVTGVVLKRRVFFMDKWIKHGGYYPTYLLRLWRFGDGKYEDRWMDEHVKLERGKSIFFENDFVDHNLNNLTWWTEKHNNYSTREAIDLLNIKYKFYKSINIDSSFSKEQDKRKRWFKEKVYSHIPLFVRPFFYFIYRYFFKLGFLDGKPGLIWHFLQGFWYRFLVDTKIYQIESLTRKQNKSINDVIKEHYGFDI